MNNTFQQNQALVLNDPRETFIKLAIGMTGVGKTYAIILEILAYIATQKRRVYIFDTNLEEGYKRNFPRTIDANDIWKHKAIEVRRILPINPDGSPMSPEEQRAMAVWLAFNCKNCLIVYDDIDNYYRGSKGREISKLFTAYRHSSLDVILTHQSLAPIQTIEWQNCTMIRLHKTVDQVDRIKDRVPNYELLKIAQLIVDEQYDMADVFYKKQKISKEEYKKRSSFFLYVNVRRNKIIGRYSPECFRRNASKFLRMNHSRIRDFERSDAYCSNIKDKVKKNNYAIKSLVDTFQNRYYEHKG